MKLIIEIPDNYDLSKIQNGSIASKIILNAVANGTPLPKGHNIVDGTELNRYLDDLIYAEQKIRLDGYETRTDIIERIKINADFLTIIEADKESKDADSN